MPTITRDIFNEFCDLCDAYGLPCETRDPGFNWTLLDLYARRKNGEARTPLENMTGDDTTVDYAGMLLHLKNGDAIYMGRDLYASAPTRSGIELALTGLLRQRVFRYGRRLLYSLNETAVTILEDTDGPEDGFTVNELEAVIKAREEINKKAADYMGRKARGLDTLTHIEDLKDTAERILGAVEGYGLNPTAKYSFIADYMLMAGYLDFKGKDWLYKFKKLPFRSPHKDKYDFIKGIMIKTI